MFFARVHCSSISQEEIIELLNRARQNYLYHFLFLRFDSLRIEKVSLYLPFFNSEQLVTTIISLLPHFATFLFLVILLEHIALNLLTLPKRTHEVIRIFVLEAAKLVIDILMVIQFLYYCYRRGVLWLLYFCHCIYFDWAFLHQPEHVGDE